MRFTYTQKNPRRISQLRSCIATAGPGSGIVPATPTRLMVMSGCTMNWPNSSVMPGHRPPPTRSGRGAISLRSTAGTLPLPANRRRRNSCSGTSSGVRAAARQSARILGVVGAGPRGGDVAGKGSARPVDGLLFEDASYRQPNPMSIPGQGGRLMPNSCMAVKGGPPSERSAMRGMSGQAGQRAEREVRGKRQGAVARGLHGRRRGQRPTWANWSARRLTQNGSSGAGEAGPVIAVGGSKHTREGASTTHLAMRDPRALPAEGALTPATGRVCIDPCRARR